MTRWVTACLLLFSGWGANCALAGDGGRPEPIGIDFFFEPGCSECEKIEHNILPRLETEYQGQYLLRRHDVGVESNALAFFDLESRLGITNDTMSCMFLDQRYCFAGYAGIAAGLFRKLAELVAERREETIPAADTTTPPNVGQGRDRAEERMSSFVASTVVLAGLVDGINPCAISTLAFLLSLLAVARVVGRTLLLIGSCFCLASFLTYIAIGFGLLHLFHTFSGLPNIRTGFEILMVAVLAVFAVLSFWDAYRYARSGDVNQVTLQLPRGVKLRIHSLMRRGIATRNLAFGAFAMGVAVTGLESVCTGQVYVPVLVLMIKSGASSMKAWGYLVLYNLLFIAPLIIVVVLAYVGVSSSSLLQWSRRHVVLSKVLMGMLFLTIATLIIWL